MSTFPVPARLGRRQTTLGDPSPRVSTLAAFDRLLKETYRPDLQADATVFWNVLTEADPWDEAVKWIERRHAPEPIIFDWAWPER